MQAANRCEKMASNLLKRRRHKQQRPSENFDVASVAFLDREPPGVPSLNAKAQENTNRIFRLFHSCHLSKIKVVIIGQDPYHGNGQAEGFSFSVPKGIKIPSSLRNIYKELSTDSDLDVKFKVPHHGHLSKWVEQGVFLLNASLTVQAGKAGSHLNKGWQDFTTAVLKYIDKHCNNVVFMLWGNFAKNKGKSIDIKKHYVLESVHPSGLSAHRGFYGCQHFSKCNKYLKSKGLEEINWQI